MTWRVPLNDSDVLALLMDHFPGLLFVKDEEFRIVAANEFFLSLYPPETRDQVIGTTTLEDYPEEQRNLFLANDQEALTNGVSEVVERIDFPGGQARTMLTRKVGKTGTDGRRYLIGAAVDITEIEESRNEAAQLWELIEQTSAEIFVVDEETLEVLRMSCGARENLGWAGGSGGPVNFGACLDPELRKSFLAVRRELAQDPNSRHTISGSHVRLDGSHYEVRAQVLRSRVSSSDVIVVVAQDIGEDLRQQRQLTRQNDALTEFAYRVSHDLRSPVVSSVALIKLAVQMLEAGNSEEAIAILARTSNALCQAETLAEDLLTLTRIEQLHAEPQLVSLVELVSESIERIQGLHGGERMEYRVDLAEIDCITTARERVARIFDNLLSNAYKYRDTECDRSWVRISARRSGDMIELVCEDNGMGVDDLYQHKLFSMFQRFHVGVAPGSGLGLYMVSRTANQLGGTARYEAAEPGARFIISLSERTEKWN